MNIELSDDEALVLLEMLHSYEEQQDERAFLVRDAAERNALWALCARLEEQLVAPFQANHQELLAAARARLEEKSGGW